jgi:hypothetical protein
MKERELIGDVFNLDVVGNDVAIESLDQVRSPASASIIKASPATERKTWAFMRPFAFKTHPATAVNSLALRTSFVIWPFKNLMRSAPVRRSFVRGEKSKKAPSRGSRDGMIGMPQAAINCWRGAAAG